MSPDRQGAPRGGRGGAPKPPRPTLAEARYDARIERAPWTTRALVGLLVALHFASGVQEPQGAPFLIRLLWPRPEAVRIRWGALDPGRFADGEAWRLLSYGLLHVDALHLGLNALALWGLGRAAEAVYGPVRTLWVFALSVIGGGLLSLVGGGTLLVGASGGVFGLLGALVAFGVRRRAALPPSLRAIFGWRLWPWIALNLGIGFALPMVNDKAHLGGLFAGALAALPLGDHLTPWAPRRGWTLVLIALLTAGFAGTLGLAQLGRP